MEQRRFFSVLEICTSKARFEPYHDGGQSEESAAWGRYVWNVELSKSLYPSLSSAEVALRNRIHIVAAQKFGTALLEATLLLDRFPCVYAKGEQSYASELEEIAQGWER